MNDLELCEPVETAAYDAVVQDYLDFMLRAVTVPIAAPVQAAPVQKTQSVQKTPVVPTTVKTAVAAPANSIAAPVTAQDAHPRHEPNPARELNGRPEWAQQDFSCLLFHVNGLKLVAPLTELGGITELNTLTPIFAQPDWFMGLLRWNGRNIRVVDTARLIMPERTAAGDGHRDRYRCVLMLDDSDWGLAVDSDAESIRLAPGDVRWRGNRTSRPWLAGTLAERLCALLDVRALTQHLRDPQGAASAK